MPNDLRFAITAAAETRRTSSNRVGKYYLLKKLNWLTFLLSKDLQNP